MKFLIAFVALVAVAVATPIKYEDEYSQVQAIIAAIQSPNTDPATAVLLEQQLEAIIAAVSPISVGPAIVDVSPVAIGPTIIDFPLPDGGAVTAVEPAPVAQPIVPSPVVIGEIPTGAPAPLVQILVNVNGQQLVPGPAVAPVEPHVPGPVNVVDGISGPQITPVQVAEPVIVDPVQVGAPIIVDPVQVAEPIVVSPVQVAEPIAVSPVQVAQPIEVSPVVVLPDTLN